MFRELNAMIDQLHTATQGQPFAAVRFQMAMNEISTSYNQIISKVGYLLADALNKKYERKFQSP